MINSARLEQRMGVGQQVRSPELGRAGIRSPPVRARQSASVLGLSFSTLSRCLSASESIVNHFLPLGHGAPPSFSVEEPLGSLLGAWGWKGSVFVAFVTRMQPFPSR